MKIKNVAFVFYPVTDLKKARAFYEGVLGLKETKFWGKDDQGFVEYDMGPDTIAIANGEGVKPAKEQGVYATLEVEDFNEAMAELKKAKVKFISEPSESPVCHMAIICDPDGNQIMIHKRKPEVKKK